jgi:hypothetical protein
MTLIISQPQPTIHCTYSTEDNYSHVCIIIKITDLFVFKVLHFNNDFPIILEMRNLKLKLSQLLKSLKRYLYNHYNRQWLIRYNMCKIKKCLNNFILIKNREILCRYMNITLWYYKCLQKLHHTCI